MKVSGKEFKLQDMRWVSMIGGRKFSNGSLIPNIIENLTIVTIQLSPNYYITSSE